MCAGSAVIGAERELLELAQQPLLAIADVADERAGAVGLELESQLAGARDRPLGQLPGLDAHLRADVAAGREHRGVKAVRRLVATLLAGEERDRRLRGHRAQRRRQHIELLVLPALDAVDDDEPPAQRQRHRVQRGGGTLGRGLLAFEQLDPFGATDRFGQRTQPGAALGDAPVVVAVDQIGRLEGGRHCGRVYVRFRRPRRRRPTPARAPRRRPACRPAPRPRSATCRSRRRRRGR